GIWETKDTSFAVVNRQEFANWACSVKAQSSQDGLSFSIPGQGDLSGSKATSSSSNDCSTSSGTYQLSSDFKQRIRTAAKSIADSWERCVNALGTNVSVLYGEDPVNFTIFIKRNSDVGPADAEVTSWIAWPRGGPVFNCD